MITDPEWNAIRDVCAKTAAQVSGRRSEFFTTETVIKRDEDNRLIWIKGWGDDPIPIIDFEHEIRYYDTDGNGNVIVRNAKAVTLVPKVGQTVLVAYEMGISRLPRCLGVIQSTNWITSED